MALIACTECKAQVSDQAKTCPQCGAIKFKPVSPKPKTNWKLIGIVSVLGSAVVLAMLNKNEEERIAVEAAKSPEQRAKEAKEKSERLEQQTLTANAVQILKASAKDPGSFALTDAYGGKHGAGCIGYRAKNSFAAVVPGSAVAQKSGKILVEGRDGNKFVDAWNKACADGGPDFKTVINMVVR